jgi:tRNA G18 (ribose-2'-O)-methylase SpoU
MMGVVARVRTWLLLRRLERRFRSVHERARETATPGPHALVVVLDHPRPFRNPARIVRSADAFGASAVYLVGTEFFDPLPSAGLLGRVPVDLFGTYAEAHAHLRSKGYAIFVLVQAGLVDGASYLHDCELPERSAIVIGNELHGLSFSLAEYPDARPVTIAQYGEAPCLTSAMAATVAMYEYTRRHGTPRPSSSS